MPTLIPLHLVDPNPYQPRTHFDPDALDELAEDIRKNGLIQPPLARVVNADGSLVDHDEKAGQLYAGAVTGSIAAAALLEASGCRVQLAAGERRVRAYRLLAERGAESAVPEGLNSPSGFGAVPLDLRPLNETRMATLAVLVQGTSRWQPTGYAVDTALVEELEARGYVVEHEEGEPEARLADLPQPVNSTELLDSESPASAETISVAEHELVDPPGGVFIPDFIPEDAQPTAADEPGPSGDGAPQPTEVARIRELLADPRQGTYLLVGGPAEMLHRARCLLQLIGPAVGAVAEERASGVPNRLLETPTIAEGIMHVADLADALLANAQAGLDGGGWEELVLREPETERA